MEEIEIEEWETPSLGSPFPEMEVNTTKGPMELPKAYKGKWFVLFSHPADFTPVCTTEFIAFQNRYEEFKKLNCELIGLSIEQVFAHLKWLEWIEKTFKVKIEFPVIADELGYVAEILGMLHPQKGTNTVRAVYIVDNKGVIRAMLFYPQEIGRSVDEILRMVKAMQTSDKYGVALPHNWPHNELIKDAAIIPPAKSEKEKQKREEEAKKGRIKCYDWWFCYKKIKP